VIPNGIDPAKDPSLKIQTPEGIFVSENTTITALETEELLACSRILAKLEKSEESTSYRHLSLISSRRLSPVCIGGITKVSAE
jgi:hypothetical protein